MADNDLSNQLEDMLSNITPESTTVEMEDDPLLRGIVDELLKVEAVAGHGALELGTPETFLSSLTGPVAGERKYDSLSEEIVAGSFEDESAGKSDVTKLAGGATVALSGKLIGRGLIFLTMVVLARLLGPKAFGLYAIGWTILRIAEMMVPLGLDNGVIRYASRYWRVDHAHLKGVLFQSFGLALLSGLLLGISLYLTAPWLGEQVFGKPGLVPVLRWLSLALPLVAGLKVAVAATRVSKRMRYAAQAQDFAQPATNLLLIFALVYLLGWGLRGAVIAGVSSFCIALILAIRYVKLLFPEIFSIRIKPKFISKALLTFSLPVSFAAIFGILIYWIDRLMVGYFLPAAEVGIYQAVSQTSLLFAVILAGLNAILSPMIADLCHRENMVQLKELFRVGTKWGLYLSLPPFLVICFWPREVLVALFDIRYAGGYLPLVILAVAQLINIGTGAVNILLIMSGRQMFWLIISVVMLFANIALNWVLIPRLRLVGAALVTAATISGLFLTALLLVKLSMGLWPYDRRYLKGALATVATTVALFLLRLAGVHSPTLVLVIALLTATGVFGAVLMLMGLDDEDKEFIILIKSRMGHIGSGVALLKHYDEQAEVPTTMRRWVRYWPRKFMRLKSTKKRVKT